MTEANTQANGALAPLHYPDGLVKHVLGSTYIIAMVGASAKPVRPSYMVMAYLQKKGFRVIPINPGLAGSTLLDETVHASLCQVPEPIDMVDVFRRADAVPGILDEMLTLATRPKTLWLQLAVRDDASAARAEAAGITTIMDRCPKIEFGRLSGEIQWAGFNQRRISSRRPRLGPGTQSRGLGTVGRD